MNLNMLKGKIHRATVVQAELDYVGSITVDEELLEAAGILEYEKVQIVDVNNGSRFETYTICGKRGSGMICLNGAAARCVSTGDKIIIMADADVDGAHIATLIMTLFFRFMRPVIENGYLYIATPPLYSVKKGNKEQRYCWTDKELEQLVNEMSNGKGDAGLHIQRYKGLGEMSKEQLWETTMSPENRILRQVSIENAADADRIFSMLMGDDVPPRRQFIEQNATYATIDA